MSSWDNRNINGNVFNTNFQNQNNGMAQWSYMQPQNLPRYNAPLLHGRAEAEAFLMGPNSQIYLPDADQDIIWWIRTDMTGAKSIIPFDVFPHQEPQPVNVNDLAARLAALEETINAKSNKSNAKRNGRSSNNANPNDDAE